MTNKIVIRSDGKIYASIQEAAAAHGENIKLFRGRIEKYPVYRGYSYEIRNARYLLRSDGKRYDTTEQAARDCFVSDSAIKFALANRSKSAGYGWKWVDVMDEINASRKPKAKAPRPEEQGIYTLTLYKRQSYAVIGAVGIAAPTDKLAETAALAIFAYLQKQNKQTRKALQRHMSRDAINQLSEMLPMPAGFWAKMPLRNEDPILIEDLSTGIPSIPAFEDEGSGPVIHLRTEDLLRRAS